MTSLANTPPQQDHDDWTYHVAHLLHRQADALERIAQNQGVENSNRLMVPVGATRKLVTLDEWLPGVRRTVAPDRSQGIDSLPLVSATPTDVVTAVAGRIGGTIVNTGISPVILYLANATTIQTSTAGRAALWLAANGGSWDFLLGSALWCGPVAAIAQGGASTLSIAQV